MGYRAVNKKVVIEEDEAKVVRFIYEQYAAGQIVRDIAERLQAQGISFHGKPFLLNTVYHILRLEKYTGICRYGGTVYADIFPAIIPKPLYDKVQQMLRYNKKGSRSVVTEYLLRQNVICANGQHKIIKAAELNVDQSRNPISDYGFPINLFI